MRGTFARTLAELGAEHPQILLATADLGYMALEPFSDALPEQFFNFGVAEQNMLGVCTGLAEAGFIPFAYSIATFASMRGYEFARNGAIRHGLPVRIIGIGAGFDYGPAGSTHHALEDAGLFRIQPGITVIAPADARQARNALLGTWNLQRPIYYRLSKDDNLIVPGLDGAFRLGRLEIVRTGRDVLIVTSGAITIEACACAEELDREGISATVAVVSSFNPSPSEDLANLACDFDLVVSVEAHYANGGLGSFVAETLSENGISARLVRCAVSGESEKTGSQSYYNALHGISREGIARSVRVGMAAKERI